MLEVCRSHKITHRNRTPLDEGSARRRDFCVTTRNTHKRQTSMPPAGFHSVLSFTFIFTSLSWLSWLCLLSILYKTHNTNIHVPGGIRTRNPSKRAAVSSRRRSLGHCDRHCENVLIFIIKQINEVKLLLWLHRRPWRRRVEMVIKLHAFYASVLNESL